MAKSKPPQPRPPALRRWTKENLTRNDYAFAIAENGGDCLAVRLWKQEHSKRLVADMLIWELFRELALPKGHNLHSICRRGPFLDEPTRRSSINVALAGPPDEMLPPPLEEIPPGDIPAWLEQHEGIDNGETLHAFVILRYDNTDATVARFREWLVKFKQSPDPVEWREEQRRLLAKRGRLSFDATLRALAVYRLKQAGHTREKAETLLHLKRNTLSRMRLGNVETTDQWAKLPRRAKREIQALADRMAKILVP